MKSSDWERARREFPPTPKRAVMEGLERYIGRVLDPASPSRGRQREFVVDVYNVDTETEGTAVLTTRNTTFAPHPPVSGALIWLWVWECPDGSIRNHAHVVNPHMNDEDRAQLRAALACGLSAMGG